MNKNYHYLSIHSFLHYYAYMTTPIIRTLPNNLPPYVSVDTNIGDYSRLLMEGFNDRRLSTNTMIGTIYQNRALNFIRLEKEHRLNEIPRNRVHARHIDRRNNNTNWQDEETNEINRLQERGVLDNIDVDNDCDFHFIARSNSLPK